MLYGNLIILALGYSLLPTDGAIIPMRERTGKLSLVEWKNYNHREPEGRGTYAFGYDIDDIENNNVQFRNEEKLSNGSVVGNYGYLDPNGDVVMVRYIADERGYRANTEKVLKLGFLRPLEEYKPSTGQNSVNNRIVTPDENASNLNPPYHPFTSQEESNAFYYPQNILGSTNFKPTVNKSEIDKFNTQEYPPDFNSIEESNAFYYPQNILQSTDFYDRSKDSDQIIFQRKSRRSNYVKEIESNSKNVESSSFLSRLIPL
ncbi:uncharacterized protein LOC123678021 [Harmonia axyridis]|uniref:uncharacterized protein LOC123678021 n=1 Tax=Harmonia axyridis TaxID=115357 RepID=UPI001E27650C|nr:uncharacterized protein LOC123678021 [Harmonia axyridis]